ncbi:MAG: hypothetical protein ACRDRO_14740 [Pseudonocardiaceae bacterium]
MLAPYGKCRVSQFSDMLMLNREYGWYVNTGDLAAAERAWEQELRGWAGVDYLAWDVEPIIGERGMSVDGTGYPTGSCRTQRRCWCRPAHQRATPDQPADPPSG